MTHIRLYMDEDSMNRTLVHALRARNLDVVTAIDCGMVEHSDEQHLDYATAHGRVLFTFNVADFYRLHCEYLAQGQHHAGMILAPQQRYSVGEQTRRLLRLLATKSAENIRDAAEFLSAW
ncbi:MAG: hypothetical protein CVU38_16730 [Chloroflexi bacterium HGW-Chloroflexi-1]|nr:MAG: hypothetical protein CVU38_16730 [Chloroflexi bacterium HGW-Chloroflexi-1]